MVQSIYMKRESLAKDILRGIAIAGMAVVAASNPYFGIYALRALKREYKRKQWRQFYHSLHYLDRRGYVKILKVEDQGIHVQITRKGTRVAKRFDIGNLKLKRQTTWDNKWRVIVFDVPVEKNKHRLAFTEKLKELGFALIQKSVWAYPYECYEEIMLIRSFYGIQQHVTYFEAVNVEDEGKWRAKFKLPGI